MSERTDTQTSGRLRLGIALGALIGLIGVRRLTAPRRMPFLDAWQRTLAENHGEAEAAALAARAQDRYDTLLAGRARPGKLALRLHQERGILPGLALYQTLRDTGTDMDTALAEMRTLMASSVTALRALMAVLGKAPEPFAVFRRVEPWVVSAGFPSEGWEIEPVQHDDRCIAYNVHRCFYLDALTAYGAPELTAVFCGGDDLVFPALAPAITWERTMTLGRGEDHCDFRWCRGDAGDSPTGVH